MEVLAALSCPHLAFSSRPPRRSCMAAGGNGRFRAFCSRLPKHNGETKSDYKPGFVDDLLLSFFRKKMVEEVGWDSEKFGYDGLIEVVNRLMMKAGSNLEAEQSAVRILKSLFPPLITVLFKMLIAPISGGQLGSMMVARVTALFCQWLMGACSVNTIELPDGSSCSSGVFVEKCKYLEESNCVGICINTCKLPTQTFFKDCMGIPLYMEPKFSDYSCQVQHVLGVEQSGEEMEYNRDDLELWRTQETSALTPVLNWEPKRLVPKHQSVGANAPLPQSLSVKFLGA